MKPAGHRECEGRVKRFMGVCESPATVERDGKWFCWRHDPVRLDEEAAAARAKRKAEMEQEEADQKRRWRVRDAGLRVIDDATLAAVERLGGLQAMIRRLDELATEVDDLRMKLRWATRDKQDPGY